MLPRSCNHVGCLRSQHPLPPQCFTRNGLQTTYIKMCPLPPSCPLNPCPTVTYWIRWWWVGTVGAQEFAFQLGPQLIPTMSTFENQPTIPHNLPDTFLSEDRQGKEQFNFQFQVHFWHHHGQKKPSFFPLKICWITYTTLFSKSERDKVVPVDWQGF